MNSSTQRLLIVGGSTRAAAWSAVRAGFLPVCADLFADADTRSMAEIVPVREYPSSLPGDIANVQAAAWMFTGGLENQPDLLAQIGRGSSSYGPLLGPSPSAIQLVRDPFWFAETLRSAGFETLAVRKHSQPPACDGSWLQKPVCSAGGRMIRRWTEGCAATAFGESHYFQRFAEGESMSGVFWRDGSQFLFLGATRQLINLPAAGAAEPFAYCGSAGPIQLPDNQVCTLTAIAMSLAIASDLRGLFGLDFLKHGDSILPVELNPRYPASVEILERASGVSIISLYHDWIPDFCVVPTNVTASPFEQRTLPLDGEPQVAVFGAAKPFAKVVMYATEPLGAPDLQGIFHAENSDDLLELADVPVPGTTIDAGWPICTVISGGKSVAHAVENAQIAVHRLRGQLRNSHRTADVLERHGNAR